jgi:hypothetical protein
VKIPFKGAGLVLGLLALGGFAAYSQGQPEKHQPGRHIISVYHVAPGKQLQFLKWQAGQEELAKEAGAPPTKWYRHLDGASWDYISIQRVGDPAQEEETGKKMEALAKKRGVATGVAAWLEFRSFIDSHTDTYATGPMTAQELVNEAEQGK